MLTKLIKHINRGLPFERIHRNVVNHRYFDSRIVKIGAFIVKIFNI